MARKRRPRRLEHEKLRRDAHKDGTYDRLLAEQNGSCWICPNQPLPNRRLDIDHCHRSMKIRGLLCRRCNMQLRRGMTAEWLEKAAEYLRRSSS